MDNPEINPAIKGLRASSLPLYFLRAHKIALYPPINEPRNNQKLNVSFDNKLSKEGMRFFLGFSNPKTNAAIALVPKPK